MSCGEQHWRVTGWVSLAWQTLTSGSGSGAWD